MVSYNRPSLPKISHINDGRRIFVMESIITVVVSFIGFFLIVPFPEKANFLTREEKELLLVRLEEDGGSVRNDDISFRRILPMITDWKIWIWYGVVISAPLGIFSNCFASVLAYMASEETASSLVAFQPTILADLHWTATVAQWHTIPVYATAFVLTLASAYLSDKLNHRYLFTVLGSSFIIIGWSIELAQVPAAGARYAGMFFCAVGAFVNMSTLVVWLCTNLGKGVKRTVAMGILTGFGNCGAFVSGNVFITNQSPRYPVGFGVGLGFGCLCLVATTTYFFFLRRENHRRDKNQSTGGSNYSDEQKQDLGEAHPDFRFQL